MAFQLKNNKIKGFSLGNDYSNVATVLQDILYHTFNKSQKMSSYDGRQRTYMPNNFTPGNELIGKCPYANTLFGEQSVFSKKKTLLN